MSQVKNDSGVDRCEDCNLEKCQCSNHSLTFDTDYNDKRIVSSTNDKLPCPNCGAMKGDLWEYKEGSTYNCHCGAVLTLDKEYTVEYTFTLERVESEP